MCHFDKKTIRHIFSKDFAVLLIILTIMLLIFSYALWAAHLSNNTVLIKTVPEFRIYIAIGVISGFIFAGRAAYSRSINKTPKYILKIFLVGFCFGFIFILNIFDVYVYLFPDKIINYTSDFDIVYPGPYRGKRGHCEAGLWIKDTNTNRWIQLCINQATLVRKKEEGMDEVWVTARVNKLGSYIVDYQFIYK